MDDNEKRTLALDKTTIWGYWLNEETFVELPKLPLIHAGFYELPCDVTRPDGKLINLVSMPADRTLWPVSANIVSP